MKDPRQLRSIKKDSELATINIELASEEGLEVAAMDKESNETAIDHEVTIPMGVSKDI